ncbi:MAG: DUF3108 domain-containing protein [Burkholderiales bacterium]|nr:DUF3108 domain-containing protein [Burkholderiales bacterium]
MSADPKPRRRPQWLILIGLTLLSVLLHFLVTDQVGRSLPTADAANEAKIKRMEATYVKEVKLTAPPVGLARPAARPPAPGKTGLAKKRKVKPVDDAASKPEEKLADAAQEPASTPSAPQVVAEPASSPTKVAAAVPPVASAASEPPKGPAFEWPKATKVSFKLEGYFRGKLTGSAAVEWLRQDSKYQVHFDVMVGAMFTVQGVSEGEITPDGLYPTRNEASGRKMFTEIPLRAIVFDKDEITFPNGDKSPRPPGVQDLVSNTIQLSYRFTLDPSLLKPGTSIPVKIATAKQLEEVVFDVANEEVIDSPMGPLKAVHVKPRRLVETGTPLPPVEIWFAPNLQYLPVKMYAERKDGPREKQFTFTMQMERPPQQVGAQD